MATIKRSKLCDEICRKLGLSRRVQGKNGFDKRELLHINSAMDLLAETKGETSNAAKKNKGK